MSGGRRLPLWATLLLIGIIVFLPAATMLRIHLAHEREFERLKHALDQAVDEFSSRATVALGKEGKAVVLAGPSDPIHGLCRGSHRYRIEGRTEYREWKMWWETEGPQPREIPGLELRLQLEQRRALISMSPVVNLSFSSLEDERVFGDLIDSLFKKRRIGYFIDRPYVK
jgi:hypothetical protein